MSCLALAHSFIRVSWLHCPFWFCGKDIAGLGALTHFPLPIWGGAFFFGARALSSFMAKEFCLTAGLNYDSFSNSGDDSSFSSTNPSSTLMHFTHNKTPPGDITPIRPIRGKNISYPQWGFPYFLLRTNLFFATSKFDKTVALHILTTPLLYPTGIVPSAHCRLSHSPPC